MYTWNGGCLIAYPPSVPWTGYRVDITLYEPQETGLGETGFQMGIVFNNVIPTGETKFMSSNEENTYIDNEFVTPLGCNNILVIAKTYDILTSNEFPNGYMIVDVEVTF
jgi:hypothetical protein